MVRLAQAGRLASCRSKGEFIGCHSLMSRSHKTAPLIVSAGIYHGVDTRYLHHSLCGYIANIVYLCDVYNCKNILLENWAALLLLVLCATAAPRGGPHQQSKVIVYGEAGRLGHQWRIHGGCSGKDGRHAYLPHSTDHPTWNTHRTHALIGLKMLCVNLC